MPKKKIFVSNEPWGGYFSTQPNESSKRVQLGRGNVILYVPLEVKILTISRGQNIDHVYAF